MSIAERSRLDKQHIRRIRFHFLSRASGADPDRPTRPARLQVRIAGDRAGSWALPLAANLALSAAARLGEGILVVPPERIAAAARLLGAGALQLAPCYAEPGAVRALQPATCLTLAPPFLLPLLTRRPDLAWIITLNPQPGSGRGPWLYLASEGEGSFADPRGPGGAARGEALFVLGLEHLPAARPGITGVWGRLDVDALLDADRPGWPRYLTASASLRRRYDGYLAALSQWAGATARVAP